MNSVGCTCRRCRLITVHGLSLASVCFWMAHKLTNGFSVFIWLKKNSSSHVSLYEIQISVYPKCDWSIATHSASRMPVSASGTAAAELSSCDRPSAAHASLHTKRQHMHTAATQEECDVSYRLSEKTPSETRYVKPHYKSALRWTFAVDDGDCWLEH